MSPDTSSAPDQRLVLEIPADPAHLVTARVFAQSVGHHSGMAEDRIVDLTLAISDAATWLLLAAPSEGSVAIRTTVAEHRVVVEIEPLGFAMPTDEATEFGGDSKSALELVRALTEDLSVSSAVTFSLLLGG
ncbi:MAG: ATP-binding protein [Acidimicrobiia bacterium]